VTRSTKRDSRWVALALIVTAQFMVILDVAIVNVRASFDQVRPRLLLHEPAVGHLRVRDSCSAGRLLLGGRLADLLGRRRLIMAGLALFSASSLLCGLAWSEASLIAFRALQGLGGALLARPRSRC
jgi:hypothetical protein